MPAPLSRRQTLLQAAMAGAATACGAPPGAPQSSAVDPEGEQAREAGRVDHIVIVMMENRSFDHFLGARRLLEGAEEDGLSEEMGNPTASGDWVAPYPLEQPCVADPPHGWSSAHRQHNGGSNDGFVAEYAASGAPEGGRGVMQYLDREDLPITWALADSGAVCDRYFCSVMGPTWPNRIYAHMASSQGMTSNDFPETLLYIEPTVWEALDSAHQSWRYYYSDIPFLGLLEGHWSEERVGFLEDFVADCEAGTLPSVCWVDPAFSMNDNHPPHHHGLGEMFLATVYQALARSPLWERCLLIITYDEHGGFFDHVPPPTTEDDRAEEGFDQMGFRVPTLAVGPWVKQGAVSTTFDHTSWIRMVCDLIGVEPWNARLRAAESMAAVLDQERMAQGEPLPPVELPEYDLDPESLGPECEYGTDVLSIADHVEKARLHHRALGVPMREDPALIRAMAQALAARVGLVRRA